MQILWNGMRNDVSALRREENHDAGLGKGYQGSKRKLLG